MEGKDYCSCSNCRLCWLRISKPRVAIGLLLWVATLFSIKLATENPALWGMQWSVPFGLMILRAYSSSARLTTYFFSKYEVRWRRLSLCAWFTLLPILDFLYISRGSSNVVVRHFFVNGWANLMEDLAEEFQFRGYDVTVNNDKECMVYAMNEQYGVKINANTIYVTHNGNTLEHDYCVLDGPCELADIVVAQIEKDD